MMTDAQHRKHIVVRQEFHWLLKRMAKANGTSMQREAENALRRHFAIHRKSDLEAYEQIFGS